MGAVRIGDRCVGFARDGAGQPVTMILAGKYEVQITVGKVPPETWGRCEPTS
jgi:hypothetical protein